MIYIDKKKLWLTSHIKHLAISGLSSVSPRITSSCNLIEKCIATDRKQSPKLYTQFYERYKII